MHTNEWDEPDDESPQLPPGVTEEQVNDLVESIVAACEKIGLYAVPNIAVAPDEEFIHVYVAFEVGQLAFAKRVQDPVQDNVDEVFHRMETDAAREKFDDIRNKFIRRTPEQNPEDENT